jgi:hypothetical protein
MFPFRHPHKHLRVRGLLAKRSWLALIIIFLLAVLVLSTFLTALRCTLDDDFSQSHVLEEFYRYVLVLVDAPETPASPRQAAFLASAL